LRENLTLGLPLQTDSRILECARITGLDRVITAHPQGLERLITEGGAGLSGGQRQLMGITRLLLARPRIVLLDEPSASMDMQLERQLEEKVFGQNTVATTLIVATHKPAILSQFNRIIVIDKGRIVADGPRDKILASARPPAKIETPPTPALS
jgi:ATP-binding cassette subfamily C protein LapB